MSDLQIDIVEVLDMARVHEVPYVVALNKRTNKQIIMPLANIKDRHTILYVCLSNGSYQEVRED